MMYGIRDTQKKGPASFHTEQGVLRCSPNKEPLKARRNILEAEHQLGKNVTEEYFGLLRRREMLDKTEEKRLAYLHEKMIAINSTGKRRFVISKVEA
jgi:hypothetical protein